jgi:hypothetical protein
MVIFSKDLLGLLAGLADPNDKFQLEDSRQENTFHWDEVSSDEVTRRRHHRATHKKIKEPINEDPAMGQLSRRQVPMHKASAAVRKPQSYLTDPQFEESEQDKQPKPSLYDIFFGDDDEIHYGFGLTDDAFEEESEVAPDIYHSYGYGHGRQSGRRPGYAARSAGYIVDETE